MCVCTHIYITKPYIHIQSLSWYNVPWKHWQVGDGIWVNHCSGHLEETSSVWQAFKSWRWSELRLKSICLAAFCSKTCLLLLQPWSLTSLVLTLRCSESPDKSPMKCIRQGQGAPLLLCRRRLPAACSGAPGAANSKAGCCSFLELCPLVTLTPSGSDSRDIVAARGWDFVLFSWNSLALRKLQAAEFNEFSHYRFC